MIVLALFGFTASIQSQLPTSYPGAMPSASPSGCLDRFGAVSADCPSRGAGQKLNSTNIGPDGASVNRSQGVAPSYSDAESQSSPSGISNSAPPELVSTEPLTEFQKFAASSTGQILSIFGADLFRGVPSTFAPVDLAPIPLDYTIGPGDELRIKVWGQVNFQASVHVDRSGEVYIPLSQIGPIHVAGMRYSEITNHIRESIGRVYRNFDVLADLGHIRAVQVYVVGNARRPGVYTMSSLSTLLDALFASGGPSIQGSMRHILLRRSTTVVEDLDLYALLIHGDKAKDVDIAQGDVIFIPPVGPQAALSGSVRNPAIYELLEDESLADLISDAGGVSTVASKARVSIERIENHAERRALEMAFDPTGLASPLTDGDVVRVFSIAPKYKQTVTLQGFVANPGRFPWHPGMHVSDLIPDKDSLMARRYWWKRDQLGLPTLDFEPTMGMVGTRQPADKYAVTAMSAPNLVESAPDQNQNLDLEGARVPHSSLSGQRPLASMSGTNLFGRPHLDTLVAEIDWNYAVVLRLDPETLKTSLVPFDLGKVVFQHDALQDLELKPGDVVSILSDADVRVPSAEQTKLIKLDGEVAHPGLYTAQTGEGLRELVERAGGLTPDAYLYGSEFTREATRLIQQTRMDEYVQSLEMRIQHSDVSRASSSLNSSQATDFAAARSSERDILTRLRQVRATGRIVLEFTPDSRGSQNLPEITLENGDRFVIPSVPANINVIGAVNDQNSFLYVRDRRVGTYLQKAGGLTKESDRKRAFIIRANGEVVGFDTGNAPWGQGFNGLRLFPGDTIVVPEKTIKPSALRGILDWSQMFSQFALGAAALSVIF